MKKPIISGLASAVLLAIAVPQASAEPSFNCERARIAAEFAICGSTSLGSFDRDMSDYYFNLRSTLTGRSRRLLLAGQKDWLRRRNACGANVSCLTSAYRDRISQLENWGD